MIVLDVTIVNVALPSIQHDLHFSQGNLTWVVNAFLVTFGSLLLLTGRLGDLVGRKRVFLAGVVTFTVASLLCGVAPSQETLVGARFLQGTGAAAQASVILAIIVTEFPEALERARAMSVYVFVSVAGGSMGLLAGGVLTEALSWHWVFFVNLPIGVATYALGHTLIRADRGLGLGHGVDWVGSFLVTASLMGAIYAIVEATSHGWTSLQVLGFGSLAAALMAFISLEARIENPIMPLRILRVRGLINASLVRGLLVTGMYSTFFLGTLYLEQVRHYSALQTGAAFLPWTLTVAVLSQGITARLVDRFGPLAVLTSGMASTVGGLLLFATSGRTPPFSRRSSSPPSRSAWASAPPSCRCSPSPWPTSRPRTPGSAPVSPPSPSRSAVRSDWPYSAPSPRTTRGHWTSTRGTPARSSGATSWPSSSRRW